VKKLRKIVIPVAGLGTRVLPASKVIPKEMLTVVDKPVIQYVIEEAVAAGFSEIILVTHERKKSLEHHFEPHPELESVLESKGKTALLRPCFRASHWAWGTQCCVRHRWSAKTILR
jgi:UTP--glucose-1-phosphate uridylyltransferase